jgi:hypothetical protein
MSRLRQYFASRYASQEATSAEFENIIRYLNAAEFGNLTISELLDKIFDDNGDVDLGIEFQIDPSAGLQYRLDPTAAWVTITSMDSIRGAAGLNVGTIEAPLFSNQVEFTAGVSQTVYAYTITADAADVLVWINGVLQATTSYTYSSITNLVTLGSAPSTGAIVRIVSIRTSPATAYRRVDLTATASQISFPFPVDQYEEIIVFRNGIMQREGGSYDYIKSWQTGIITMTTAQIAGTVISIICITNDKIRDIAGLMLEDQYATNGLINLAKINIPDDALAQAKIAGLVTALAGKARITVGTTTPVGPITGDLWINTSYSVPALMFYDGTHWLNSSPNGMIPLPLPVNALQYLRLNSTATSLEYAAFDTSGLVKTSSLGAQNGAAPLNSSAQVPVVNLPPAATRVPIIGRMAGSIANTTIVVGHISGGAHSFTRLTAKLATGSLTLQLLVNGAPIGSTLAVTSTTASLAITPALVDATTTAKDVALTVTGGATPADLTYNIETQIAS